VLYASSGKQLFATFNGGGSWKSISVGLPFARTKLSYISVHPENAKILYVTFSGYSANEKIYRSEDGGETWENMSNGLPNLPANCVIFDKTKTEGVYMAMDIGIYYQENLSGTWAIYNHGLPNVPINEIEIQYSSKKIRAATYGRGVWESDLYFDPNNLPAPVITSFSPEEGNAGTTVSITGRNFEGTTYVSFNGKKAEFSYISATSVKATVPTGATTGKITLTTPNGTATSEKDFVIQEVAGFTESDFIRENVRISPNPADNFVLIHLNNIPTGGELYIFDMLGRKIRTERIRGTEGKIDISALPAGNYRLKILTEKGNAQRSLIKN
jgi:hypothetical protein